MIKNLFFLLACVFLFLLSSCNKEQDLDLENNKPNKSAGMGDKIFVDDFYHSLFSNYSGHFNFTNNNGNFTFTGTDISESEGSFEPDGTGYFTYSNQTYPLSYGLSLWVEDFQFSLGLTEYNYGLEGEIISYYIISFALISEKFDKISPGHYTFSNSLNPFTFYAGYMGLNLTNQIIPENFIYFSSGNLYISAGEDKYTIEFSGMLENGKTIDGIYTGYLKEYTIDQ